MRKQILEISRKLEAHYIDVETAKSELLNLFSVSGSTSDEFGEIAYSKDITDTCTICKYLPQITKCKACDKCEEIADITRYYR